MMQAEIVWLRDDPGLGIAAAAAALPAEERKELAGLAHPHRQRNFVLSRQLLRQILAPQLQVPEHAIRFSRAGNGRLVLAHDSTRHFSLSHAAGLIALVVATSPCGVDIEVPRAAAIESIARRYFAREEQVLLASLDADARRQAFFRLWTLKEAGVKALGEGLAHNLARLAFDLDRDPPALLDDNIALQFFQYEDDFMLSAAIAGRQSVKWRMRQAMLSDLLRSAQQ